MTVALAYGVPVEGVFSGPPDITPLVVSIAAVILARWIWGRMTIPIFVAALLAGTLWSSAVAWMGLTIPAVAAVILIAVVTTIVDREARAE